MDLVAGRRLNRVAGRVPAVLPVPFEAVARYLKARKSKVALTGCLAES